MLVFPQVDPTNFFLGKFDPRGAPAFKMETTRTPGGRNSNKGHRGSKDLQQMPPLAASTL